MNADIKAKWLAALRSGDYKQGVGFLCPVDTATGEERWCCLGVLFDVAAVDGDARWIPIFGGPNGDKGLIYWVAGYGTSTHSCSELPRSFMSAVGVTENDQDNLIRMNDTLKKNFEEIAEWIEFRW